MMTLIIKAHFEWLNTTKLVILPISAQKLKFVADEYCLTLWVKTLGLVKLRNQIERYTIEITYLTK